MEGKAAFVVDWPVIDERSPIRLYVSLRAQGRSLGLYKVKQYTARRMVVAQNDTPLTVGAQLEVGDVQGLLPDLPSFLMAKVVASDQRDVSLAW